MFGYVTVNPGELKVREYECYKGCYCGLCKELGERSGLLSRLLLSYDMTFLAMLESALYEVDTHSERRRCLVHPFIPRLQLRSEAAAYAADMTVLLGYQKARDDWQDEHKVSALFMSLALRRKYRGIRKKYPRQAKALERSIRLLDQAQKEECRDVDYVAGLTGQFLGEMFDWKEDVWSETLREMGFYLGKFIYLMDAREDLDKDEKSGNYNVFRTWKKQDGEDFEAHVKVTLTDMMTQCALRFERLPIIQDADILRNVLYAGVWMTYAALIKNKGEGERICRNRR